MKSFTHILVSIAASVAILAALIWFSGASKPVASSEAPRALTAGEPAYDFGTISMAAGKVVHRFAFSNTSGAPIEVKRLYTSCMCTAASLEAAGGRFGPFGMPGHGFVPFFDAVIPPNATGTVEAVFDPAAHGPAGVGKVERAIYLESDAGVALTLHFRALVTP